MHVSFALVKGALERCAREAPLAAYRAQDPVRCCHRYRDPRDQEVAALLAAFLSFGKVEAFLPRIEGLLDLMGPSPRRYVEAFGPAKDRKFFAAFRLRIWKGDCIRYLLGNLRELLRGHGSIEDGFLSSDGAKRGGALPLQRDGHSRHRARLTALAGLLGRADPMPWTGAPGPPLRYGSLVVDPGGGSAAKRWNLFLRWVARPADGIDLGIWKRVAPRDLVIPLDVHVWRITGLIGLRRRRSLDWKAAEEVTRALSRIDPEDPLRFDFPLSHLGISEGCRGRRHDRACGACGLRELCGAQRLKPGGHLSDNMSEEYFS